MYINFIHYRNKIYVILHEEEDKDKKINQIHTGLVSSLLPRVVYFM